MKVKILLFELNRVFKSKGFLLFSAGVLVCAFILSLFISGPTDIEFAEEKAYEQWKNDPDAVNEYYYELQIYMREHKEDEADSFPHTFSDNPQLDDLAVLISFYERAEYLKTYPERIDEKIRTAEINAENLLSLGYSDTGYSVCSQQNQAEQLKKIRNCVDENSGYAFGLDSYIENNLNLLLVFLYATLSATYLYLDDKKHGFDRILRSTCFGRGCDAVARSCAGIIIAAIGCIMISAVSLLAVCSEIGFSGLLLPIQAYPEYAYVPIKCSAAGFIAIQTMLRCLAASAYTAFLCFCCELSGSYLLSVAGGSAFCAVSYALFSYSSYGTVLPVKYLSFAAAAEANALFSFFRTVNFFGTAVSDIPVTIVLQVLRAALFITVTFVLADKRIRLPLLKIIPLSDRKTFPKACKNQTRCSKIHSLSLFCYEIKKNRLSQMLALFAACLAISSVYLYYSSGSMKHYDEALYYKYIENLQNKSSEKIQDYVYEERERINSVLGLRELKRSAYANGEITRDEYLQYMDDYYDAQTCDKVFTRIEDNAGYVIRTSRRYDTDIAPVYDTGINLFFKEKTNWFLVCAIILICSRGYNAEFGASQWFSILRGTVKGRKHICISKIFFFGGLGAFFALTFRFSRYMILKRLYLFPDLQSPACAIKFFSSCGISYTLADYFIGDMILNLCGGFLLGVLIILISRVFRKYLFVVCFATAVLAIPEILAVNLSLIPKSLSILNMLHPQNILGNGNGPVLPVVLSMAMIALCSFLMIIISEKTALTYNFKPINFRGKFH